MTAVEWFAKQVLRSRQLGFISNEKFNELLAQAKEMEKEQIKDAYDEGAEEWCDGFYVVDISSESYYNKTFK